MAKVIDHGITELDYDNLKKIIDESKHERSSVYERDTYMLPRQESEDKDITDKCSEWYKHSSFAIRIKNKEDMISYYQLKKMGRKGGEAKKLGQSCQK